MNEPIFNIDHSVFANLEFFSASQPVKNDVRYLIFAIKNVHAKDCTNIGLHNVEAHHDRCGAILLDHGVYGHCAKVEHHLTGDQLVMIDRRNPMGGIPI